MQRTPRVTVLAGGVGAARFLRGLSPLLDPRRFTIVINTGDDETFFGLSVSPDIDTVTYTLAGRAAAARGWGLRGDTFRALTALARYYPETWFRIGDADVATHLFRTDALGQGRTLSQVTAAIAAAHGLRMAVLPMTDARVRTVVHIDGVGPLAFQQYLVARRGAGCVRRISFTGARQARPAPGVLRAIRRADFIILPPSNPFVSIRPILAVPGILSAVRQARARVAAISPIVGGAPVKGPLHRMLAGMGHEVSPLGVARLYKGLVELFVIDRRDAAYAARIAALGMRPLVAETLMTTPARSRQLAAAVLAELRR